MRQLFLAALCVAALLTRTDPESAHEYSRLGTVDSLVERGTYQLDDSIFIVTVDKIYRNGHFYSHQPPLLATIEAPVYWVIHLPGLRFNNRGRSLSTYLFSLLTNGVALALTVVVFAQILALAGMAPPGRNVLALLLPFGTWLLPYGIVSNNHGISGLLVAILTWLLLAIEWRGATTWRVLAMGAVLGLLTTIEILPLVSFVPLTLAFLATKRLGARAWTALAIGLVVPLAAHAVINIRITGDVIPAGFHHELFDYPGSAFAPDELTGSLKFTSAAAFANYAWTVLFAGKGFFTFAPLQLLGFAAGVIAWPWWSRARAAHFVLLGSIVLSLGAALLTTNNFGGEAAGFRHAVYLAPAFLTLLLPWIVDAGEARRRLVMAVGAISAVLLLLFAVRKPWSVLTVPHHPIGTWDQYVPIAAKIIRGDLFNP